VWSRRDGKTIRKTFPNLAAARAWRQSGKRLGKARGRLELEGLAKFGVGGFLWKRRERSCYSAPLGPAYTAD